MVQEKEKKKEFMLIKSKGNLYEYAGGIAPFLYVYGFDFVSSYGEVTLRKNSFYIFPKKVKNWTCSCNKSYVNKNSIVIDLKSHGCERDPRRWINLVQGTTKICEFLDLRNEIRELIEGMCIKVFARVKSFLEILYRKPHDVLIGGYCPFLNIFIASDWTYTCEGAKLAIEVVLPQLAEKLKWSKKERSVLQFKNFKPKIGTDPEFEELHTWFDYTPTFTTYESTSKEIGSDILGDQVELRPAPALTPRSLVRNLKRLFYKVSVPLSVKGDKYPLGGHIHIELPDSVKNNDGVIYTICLLLDDFLGKQLIDLSGKARNNYKILTAYEKKPWGLEYKSLPSAFLITPKIARIVFKIAQNLVQNFLTEGKIVYNNPPTKEDYVRLAGLTEKEWKEFNRFLIRYKAYNGRPINQNWARIRVLNWDIIGSTLTTKKT